MISRVGYFLTYVFSLTLAIGCSSAENRVVEDEDGPTDTAISIFELNASENGFSIGALLKNAGTKPYAFNKRDARIYFTPFDQWAYIANMDFAARTKIVITASVRVTSWEDGDSPALRIAPGQEKWVRLEGKLDAANAKKFLDAKAKYASLGLFRLLKSGAWHSSSSVPFPLWYTLEESLEQYCRRVECK